MATDHFLSTNQPEKKSNDQEATVLDELSAHLRVADGAGAFFDEQDSGCEIPFVLRLDGEGSPDTIGSSGEAQRRQEPLLLMDFYSSARAAYL